MSISKSDEQFEKLELELGSRSSPLFQKLNRLHETISEATEAHPSHHEYWQIHVPFDYECFESIINMGLQMNVPVSSAIPIEIIERKAFAHLLTSISLVNHSAQENAVKELFPIIDQTISQDDPYFSYYKIQIKNLAKNLKSETAAETLFEWVLKNSPHSESNESLTDYHKSVFNVAADLLTNEHSNINAARLDKVIAWTVSALPSFIQQFNRLVTTEKKPVVLKMAGELANVFEAKAKTNADTNDASVQKTLLQSATALREFVNTHLSL